MAAREDRLLDRMDALLQQQAELRDADHTRSMQREDRLQAQVDTLVRYIAAAPPDTTLPPPPPRRQQALGSAQASSAGSSAQQQGGGAAQAAAPACALSAGSNGPPVAPPPSMQSALSLNGPQHHFGAAQSAASADAPAPAQSRASAADAVLGAMQAVRDGEDVLADLQPGGAPVATGAPESAEMENVASSSLHDGGATAHGLGAAESAAAQAAAAGAPAPSTSVHVDPALDPAGGLWQMPPGDTAQGLSGADAGIPKSPFEQRVAEPSPAPQPARATSGVGMAMPATAAAGAAAFAVAQSAEQPKYDGPVEVQKASEDGPPPQLGEGDDDIFWVSTLHVRTRLCCSLAGCLCSASSWPTWQRVACAGWCHMFNGLPGLTAPAFETAVCVCRAYTCCI